MERFDFIWMGHKLGTASGFDIDSESLSVYDFEPAELVMLPAGELLEFNAEKGMILYHDDEGNTTEQYDAIEILNLIPREKS